MAKEAKQTQQAETMYYQVLARIWGEEDKHSGQQAQGIGRRMAKLPVSVDGRRPLIQAELMDIPHDIEPADVSARRRPNGVLRLAFSTPDPKKPYGSPVAVPSDYGSPVGEEETPPANRSVGVDLMPGERPEHVMVERPDGQWEALEETSPADALLVAGALAKALSDPEREVQIIREAPSGDPGALGA